MDFAPSVLLILYKAFVKDLYYRRMNLATNDMCTLMDIFRVRFPDFLPSDTYNRFLGLLVLERTILQYTCMYWPFRCSKSSLHPLWGSACMGLSSSLVAETVLSGFAPFGEEAGDLDLF